MTPYRVHLDGWTAAPPTTYRDAAPDGLPTDGARITLSMLDSTADLKALVNDSKRWTKEAILAEQGAG
jgi:hypothetical protein